MTRNNSEQREYDGLREDDELLQQIAARRRVRDAQKRRKKRLSMAAFVLVFLLLSAMWGKDIVRLKAENRSLKKQQTALEQQRDDLKEELTHVDDPEYIREQARKQLRLLNPGEILFNFDDGSAPASGTEETVEGEGEDAAEDGGSDG